MEAKKTENGSLQHFEECVRQKTDNIESSDVIIRFVVIILKYNVMSGKYDVVIFVVLKYL